MCGSSKAMASQPVLPVEVGASRDYGKLQQMGKLNPWAQEFTPLYTYTNVQKPALPLYPPPPTCFLSPPTVNTPITYNIYTAQHLQMNYIPPIGPSPMSPYWNGSIPISVFNTHYPNASNSAQPSSDPLNISVYPPPQQGFMDVPRSQEYQSRSLLLSFVPTELSGQQLQQELLAWGPIRRLDLQRKHQGLVIVDYYDLRHAAQALDDINQQRMVEYTDKGGEVVQQASPFCWGLIRGKAVWAQYAKPTAKNQGTLVVFNLDTDISPESLRATFEQYGALKEVREPPLNNQVKFVEFFDVRDAYRAREALDEQEIGSKRVKIQFSHLGSRALRGVASPFHNQPPRHRQTSDNFRWTKGNQFCTHQAGVANNDRNILRDQTDLGNGQASGRAVNTGGHATCTDTSDGRGSFHEITGEHSSQFDFDEGEALSNRAQARTTVMIKNIPNKYDLDMLLKMLDSHCVQCNQNITEADGPLSEYDFVYLPIDFKNRCNLGYAFVNFTSGKATWKLYKDLHMHQWAIFNSKKICEVTYARLQGRRLLEDHFRNARLECDTENYLPLVFDPPRTGQNFPATRVIRGHSQAKNGSYKHQGENHDRQNAGQNYNRVHSDCHSSRSWCARTPKQTFYRVKSAAAGDHFNNQS